MSIPVPEDVVDFIGKPSLLQTEAAADYDALLLRLAEAVKPKDVIEWIWVADVTHLVWEMRRLRGIRDGIVERETAQGLGHVVSDILSADYDWYEVMFIVVLICNSLIISNIEHFSCVYIFSLGEEMFIPSPLKFP